jgi:hypothetical protein
MPELLCPVLVGRDQELGQLRSAVDRVAAGHGTTLVVLGEAGVGKSRLVREAAEGYNRLMARGRRIKFAEPPDAVVEARGEFFSGASQQGGFAEGWLVPEEGKFERSDSCPAARDSLTSWSAAHRR